MGMAIVQDERCPEADDSEDGARRLAARVMDAIHAHDAPTGSVLGVVGTGAAGAAVARQGLARGMHVVAARRHAAPPALPGVETASSLVQLIAASDQLVLACPRTVAELPEIDGDLLDYAKPDLHLIDIAYGTLIDHRTLLCALMLGKIGRATLPRPEPARPDGPLWRHPQVALTAPVEIGSTLTALAQYHHRRTMEGAGR